MEDLSAITKRLKELADQKGAYKLKYREKISMVWSCAVMVLGSRSLWRYLEKNKSSFRHGPGESESLEVLGKGTKIANSFPGEPESPGILEE